MLIALCGKSGSGKTTLENLLKERNKNAVHLDIDKIGHEALLTDKVKKELFFRCENTNTHSLPIQPFVA